MHWSSLSWEIRFALTTSLCSVERNVLWNHYWKLRSPIKKRLIFRTKEMIKFTLIMKIIRMRCRREQILGKILFDGLTSLIIRRINIIFFRMSHTNTVHLRFLVAVFNWTQSSPFMTIVTLSNIGHTIDDKITSFVFHSLLSSVWIHFNLQMESCWTREWLISCTLFLSVLGVFVWWF